jgi:hypothetical protein
MNLEVTVHCPDLVGVACVLAFGWMLGCLFRAMGRGK